METEKSIDDSIEFWGTNPNVLFLPQHLNELFPTNNMTYERKLNAISRLVIILTIFTYLATHKTTIIIVCIASLVLIYVIHSYFQQKKRKEKKMKKISENFANVFQNVEPKKNPVEEVVANHNGIETLEEKKFEYFDMAKPDNPLSNVMLTDYANANEKKHAPPAYTEEGREAILQKTKEMIDKLHPDQQPPNTEQTFTEKLFGDLSENLAFEQSMRQYTSNPSTTIPNDQNAFANFCYGGMVSCKEGNAFACVRNNLGRHIMM